MSFQEESCDRVIVESGTVCFLWPEKYQGTSCPMSTICHFQAVHGTHGNIWQEITERSGWQVLRGIYGWQPEIWKSIQIMSICRASVLHGSV